MSKEIERFYAYRCPVGAQIAAGEVVLAADHDAAMAEKDAELRHLQCTPCNLRAEAAETALRLERDTVPLDLERDEDAPGTLAFLLVQEQGTNAALRAENDRQERLIQDYMMSQGAFPMAVSRIVTAPDADDLEALIPVIEKTRATITENRRGIWKWKKPTAEHAALIFAAIASRAQAKSAEVAL